MKNLARFDVELIDNTPIELLDHRLFKRKQRETRWRSRWKPWHWHKGGVYLSKIIDRVVLNNIGKSFDLTYNYYRTLVPKAYHSYFFYDFDKFGGRVADAEYYIDENGLIQANPNSYWIKRKLNINSYKGPYTYKSEDYETELRHRITGHKKKDFVPVYEKITRTYTRKWFGRSYTNTSTVNGKLLYYEYGAIKWHEKPAYERYRAQERDFIPVCIKGWAKTFNSKQDSEFRKLLAEKQQRKRKADKEAERLKKEKVYSFISKAEEERKREKERNELNIVRHGFDPVSSFRG